MIFIIKLILNKLIFVHRPPRPPTRRLGRPNTGNIIDIPFGGCRSCTR